MTYTNRTSLIDPACHQNLKGRKNRREEKTAVSRSKPGWLVLDVLSTQGPASPGGKWVHLCIPTPRGELKLLAGFDWKGIEEVPR